MHAVRLDPLQRHGLFRVGHLLHVHQFGAAQIGLVAQPLEGGHAAGAALQRRLHRRAAGPVGLADVGAAGQMPGAPLQGGEFDGPALAAQLALDEPRQIPAGAREHGLVAKGVQRAAVARKIAQEAAFPVLHALAGGDDDVLLLLLQPVHPPQEQLGVKGHFRHQDEVRPVAVVPFGKAGRASQPAGVAAHDLRHRHAAQVVGVGVADDLLHDGGDVLRRRAEARGVVGADQVVVDGLGHAHKADGAADGLAVGGELGDGVHAVVAADVEHRVHLIAGEQLKQRFVHLVPHHRRGQLVAAAAQIGGRGALEQLDLQIAVEQAGQVRDLSLQKPLDAVLHAQHPHRAAAAGGLEHAGEAGVDDGGGAAALTYHEIHRHTSFACVALRRAVAPTRPRPLYCI